MRVIVVDDYRFIRRYVCTMLHSTPGMEVVAEASSGEQAVALARELRPDVVLMDISLEGMSGLAATETICRELPEVRVVIVSRHVETEYMTHAIRIGASGFLPKSALGTELGPALAALASGETWFSPSILREQIETLEI